MARSGFFAQLTDSESSDFVSRLNGTHDDTRVQLATTMEKLADLAARPDSGPAMRGLALRVSSILPLFFPFQSLRDGQPASQHLLDWVSTGDADQLMQILNGMRAHASPETAVDWSVRIDDWVISQRQPLRTAHSDDADRFFDHYEYTNRDDLLTVLHRQTADDRAALAQAVVDAQQFAEAARLAAGDAGERELIRYFDEHAERESTKSWIMIGVAIVPTIAAVVLAWSVLREAHDLSAGLIIGRLTLTIPLLGLAAYFGQMSGQYRESSRWAATAKVQLQTISAFVATIGNDEDRDEVRKVLGRRVFSSPDFGNSANMTDATNTLQAMADIIAKLRG